MVPRQVHDAETLGMAAKVARAASLSLGASPSSASIARRFTRRQLDDAGWGDEPADSVVLLVSELVTNAVLHAKSGPELTIDLTSDTARVTVSDENPRLPVLLNPVRDALSGRGMHLVEQLAASWGIEPHDPGKDVWFLVQR